MKTIYKVEQTDLTGKIKDFPIEVVQKMIEEQVKQGNKADVSIFQNDASFGIEDGGFDWVKTENGYNFWDNVIENNDFALFFKKYAKKTNLVYIVGDSEIGMDIIKTLEKYGGINHHGYTGNSEGCLYYIEPNNNSIEICDFNDDGKLYEVLMVTYQPIKAEEFFVEVSMEQIAEKFGIDVNKLRIKK